MAAAPKRGPWIAGAVVLSLAIGGAGWALAISPQLQLAATARADTEAAEAQNVIHAQRLAMLEEQAAGLDVYKAELAALRVQIPAEDGVRELILQIEANAAAAGIFMVGSTFGQPAHVIQRPPTPPEDPSIAPPAEVPAASEAGEDAAAPDQAAVDPSAAAPVAGPTAEGLLAIPVDITVLGNYAATVAFIGELQKDTGRLFLVTGYSITGQKPAPASGGKPEILQGDAETVVTGVVYVLPSTATAPVADATATDTGTSDT